MTCRYCHFLLHSAAIPPPTCEVHDSLVCPHCGGCQAFTLMQFRSLGIFLVAKLDLKEGKLA